MVVDLTGRACRLHGTSALQDNASVSIGKHTTDQTTCNQTSLGRFPAKYDEQKDRPIAFSVEPIVLAVAPQLQLALGYCSQPFRHYGSFVNTWLSTPTTQWEFHKF